MPDSYCLWGAVPLNQSESLSGACPRFALQDIEFGSAPLDRRAKTTGHGLNDKAANQNHIRDPRSKEETLNALTQTQKIRSHESVGRGEDPVRLINAVGAQIFRCQIRISRKNEPL